MDKQQLYLLSDYTEKISENRLKPNGH